jgi:hypothetical protein
VSNTLTRSVRALKLAPVPKYVLFVLADAARDPDDLEAPRACWPSVPTLVEWTDLARSTVLDALKELEAAGCISREKSPGRGTVYRVLVPVRDPDGCMDTRPGTGQTSPASGRVPVRLPDPESPSEASRISDGRTGPGNGPAPVQEGDRAGNLTGPVSRPVQDPDLMRAKAFRLIDDGKPDDEILAALAGQVDKQQVRQWRQLRQLIAASAGRSGNARVHR